MKSWWQELVLDQVLSVVGQQRLADACTLIALSLTARTEPGDNATQTEGTFPTSVSLTDMLRQGVSLVRLDPGELKVSVGYSNNCEL